MATDAGRLCGAQRLLAASQSAVAFTGAGVRVLRGEVEEILPALAAA